MPTATGETALRLYTRFAGEANWTLEEAATNIGPIDLTFGGFTVGGRHATQTNHNLDAVVYRIACWTEGAPSVATLGEAEAVAATLLAEDGTLRDPAISHGLYGLPRVDLYGPASGYATGVNHGTAGAFDKVEGTFTDA